MFNIKDIKNLKPLPTKPIKDLIAITNPPLLLSDPKRQALLLQIKSFSGLAPAQFDTLGLTLIHQFTHYCQSLPETYNSYYAHPGGMFDYALNRTEAALQLFRQYIIQQEDAELSEIQKLWLYALLSASLLKDIGKLQIDYRINVFNTQGKHLKLWNPLIESLHGAGSYYQCEFEADNEDNISLRRRVNLILAYQLMPETGFSWIASNPEILACWLALLSDDWRSAGTLGAILVRADAAAIQRYFNEFLLHHQHRRSPRTARIGTFVDSTPESNLAKEQMMGIEFINWLTRAMGNGQMIVNKAPLLMVPGGLLIGVEAFKLFITENQEYKNWQAVQQGFLSLKLHRMNADGSYLNRFEQTNNQQMHNGILFENYAVALPPKIRMHNLYTGQVSSVSAIELIHLAQLNHPFAPQNKTLPASTLQQLSASGEWKVVATPSFLKPEQTKRG